MTKVQDPNATDLTLVNVTVYIGFHILLYYLNQVNLFLKLKVTWELSRAYLNVRNFTLD